MMVDAYKGMSKGFNPSKSDIDTYLRILDRNGDGKITLPDLESLAIKYLVGITGESPKRVKKQYSKFVEERLDVARRLFRKFDQDGSGFITENEVSNHIKIGSTTLGWDIQINGNSLQSNLRRCEILDENDWP